MVKPSADYQSFGRTQPPARQVAAFDEAHKALADGLASPGSLLAYGNGRSYGDSCHNSAGTIIDMRPRKRVIAFDVETGRLEAEAGLMLSEVIRLAAPHGYFPAVVPGTQFVTLGGAVANDVHGKNHHRRGSFGCHVESLTLQRSDGRTYACSPTENAGLYSATLGGMGLTGIILTVALRLMRVPSLDVAETVQPFRNLAEYFDLAEATDRDNEYAVAWIDQLASGRNAGRGLLLAGNHAPHGARAADLRPARLSVPFQPPVTVLNRPFLKLFNRAYNWRRRRAGDSIAGYRGFFFPLDGVGNWNRLYGPNGLYQHQSVVPEAAARQAVPELLAAARRAGQGSFLTVLKRFGAQRSPALMSFPRPGYTLTLDFPNHGARTLALLDELDRITVGAGGGVNPYKDARMSAATFAASFPEWQRLEAMRDPAFMSDFWARTAGRLGGRSGATAQAAE
ncbi:FAD-binding oxidoreductase [Aminobacter sp. HY435]|uniref:FAD-binding oxidoreductase n=1 Tax=Aminobacter sp. HY435 TaxID=2970917 RepID=UPI0022B97932|nr:FAD-binding oxidoreductase [Aminobacter sp. HY435]